MTPKILNCVSSPKNVHRVDKMYTGQNNLNIMCPVFSEVHKAKRRKRPPLVSFGVS